MMELNYDINEFLQHIDCFGIEWKRYMIRLLGKLKDARAVNYLIHEMQHSSSRIVRNAVLWALIDIADIRAFESLASLIQHGVVNHRRYSARLIVRALLALQTPEAISVALSIPVNSSTFVEYFHLYHLFRWTLGDNYQPVLPSLKHENPIVRGNAVICLSFFDFKYREQLSEYGAPLLLDEDEYVKRRVVEAFATHFKHPTAVKPLMELLGDSQIVIRDCATKALFGYSETIIEPLKSFIQNTPNADARWFAEQILEHAEANTKSGLHLLEHILHVSREHESLYEKTYLHQGFLSENYDKHLARAIPCFRCEQPPEKLTWLSYYHNGRGGYSYGWVTYCNQCRMFIQSFDINVMTWRYRIRDEDFE